MPYISPEVVEQARQIDLLTYLQSCEPQELVRISGNNYTTRTHDSLKISNGKWMWWSRRIGGYNALDYLVKVKGCSFVEAVETLMGKAAVMPSVTVKPKQKTEPMTREYGDGANPVILKSEFIMSLCEQLIGGSNLGAVQKSIIDRCTAAVYRNYQQNDYTGAVPTLQDFRAELIKQPEPEAQEIALSIELFTNGSLNTFAKRTNVDTDNRLICYDILDLGKQLMNNISSRTEDKLETVITETDDGNGNIVQRKNTERRTYLYITVSHKTAYDMASKYGFNQEQRKYLDELLGDENNSLWSSVLYGTSGEDNQIVAVALSQVGSVGGRPYWSWYGFNSRVEWCACFVSWCANECGYIETGIIPKYASCVNGVQWFKDRGQWLDESAEPLPGMIIFYDWGKQGQSGQQDGRADHTGIVWKVENGYVYTIEGNLSDKCTTSRRPIGEYQILGYGVPEY